jgi:peptidyl-prolyl cis-trans isomerase B (cyclophilin B)
VAAADSAASPFPAPATIPALDAVVVVRDFGEFRLRFYREAAPNHVAHFLTLAATGAFDGMSFHRIIPRYLVQIGDPQSRDENLDNDGPGGPDYRLPPEPNDRTHLRGTVSMAWQEDRPGTAGSQWFVTLSDLPELDGRATIIGEVAAGMDVVDRVSQVSTRRNRNPLRRVIVERVTLVPAPEPAAEPDSRDPVPSPGGRGGE